MAMNNFQQYFLRSCVACGENRWQQAPFTEQFFEEGKFAVFICKRCGMTPFFSTDAATHEEVLREYYDRGLYQASQVADYDEIIDFAVEKIKSELPSKEASLLDVGCGEGIALKRFANGGLTCHGIEPSRGEAQRLQRMGYNVFSGMLNEYQAPKEMRFDVITLIFVLDALQDPVEGLRQLRSMIHESGILYIRLGSTYKTPLLYQRPMNLVIQGTKHITSYHSHFFTHKTLEMCLRLTGWKVTWITSRKNTFTTLIARPAEPTPLEKIEVESAWSLYFFFIRWKFVSLLKTAPVVQRNKQYLEKFLGMQKSA